MANLLTGLIILVGVFCSTILFGSFPFARWQPWLFLSDYHWSNSGRLKLSPEQPGQMPFAFAVTLVVGLVFSLQLAIFSGVITSILLFLRKVAQPQLVNMVTPQKETLPKHPYTQSGPSLKSSLSMGENYSLRLPIYFMNKFDRLARTPTRRF